ncbi:cell wall-binding repeat-containing protein [Euzebya sp.]|uniref:cell wall-binding repeat-containing protein n=1 Tax=Euzebya sp. TaxID=1971409 RepID=UPI0035195559
MSRARARAALSVVVAAALALAATAVPATAIPEGPDHPSPEWTAREAANYARTLESPAEHLADPTFQARLAEQGIANVAAFTERTLTEPWWRSEGNICATWGEECAGDPFRYPGVDPFHDLVGQVEPVEFHDAQGARLSGRVWAPLDAEPGDDLPGVVIVNGSVQAPETLYWWLAQALVRTGYVVLTFDPRGQGRSDSVTPDGMPGSNLEPSVFQTNLVDAIDFFLSTPDRPYPGEGNGPAGTAHNPFWDVIDPDRLGAAGHSAGAVGVTVVQGLEPWPGVSGTENPIDVIVALDNLALQDDQIDSGGTDLPAPPSGVAADDVTPRVPAMGQAGDYFLTPVPFVQPPDPELKMYGFDLWRDAGVPAYQVQLQAGTHFEFSQLPLFPATPWEEGNAMAQHFAVAWFDRWLKVEGEEGWADADARLLDDATWRQDLSFYFRSARAFADRGGAAHVCLDIRAGCDDVPLPVVERVAGTDRIATAAAVTDRTVERADVVVLARADDHADALVGGPLATVLGAPLLLTSSDGLSAAAADAIEAVDARHAILLGGEAALGPQVVADAEALHLTVSRLAGEDRFATAAAVADEIGDTEVVFLAEGADVDPARGWPDALSASGLAAVLGVPVLLATTDDLPPPTAERLADREVLLVGGQAAVGPAVEAEAASLAASLRRLAGPDRYATSAAVAAEAIERGADPAITYAASGGGWPDALLAGAATGHAGGLLALVHPTDLDASPTTRDLLAATRPDIESLRVVGGPAAVADAVFDRVASVAS